MTSKVFSAAWQLSDHFQGKFNLRRRVRHNAGVFPTPNLAVATTEFGQLVNLTSSFQLGSYRRYCVFADPSD